MDAIAKPLLLLELPVLDLLTTKEIKKSCQRYTDLGYICFVLCDASAQVEQGINPSIITDTAEDYIKDLPFIKGCYSNFRKDFYTKDLSRIKFSFRSTITPPDTGLITLIEINLVHKGIVLDLKRSQMVYQSKPFADMAQRAGMSFIHYKEFVKTHSITIKSINSN